MLRAKLTILLLWLVATLAAVAQPARVILIRHAEKPSAEEDPHLSPRGHDRAVRMVKWLTEGKVLGTNGPPAALFAAAPTSHGRSLRCVETLQPTARDLHLTIRTPVLAKDYPYVAGQILRDAALRGKNVVVCWPHDYLPELAGEFGVRPKPPKWKGDDFDSAYVITFPDGKAKLQYTDEKLKRKK